MANTKVTGDLIASGTITAANLVSGTLDTLLDGYLTTNTYATQSYVTTAVNNLIDAAPASLDTLNELAAALNDDANFATTVTNSLATKLNLSGGTISGNLIVSGDLVVDTNTLYVDSTNNYIGVGLSPTNTLDVKGGITVQQASDIKWQNTARDTTYGAINSSASTIAFKFAGTEYMRIDSTGSVGIGSVSPSGLLHAYSSTADANVTIETTSSGSDARLNLRGNSSGTSQIRFGDEDSVNVGLITYFHTDNSLAFRNNASESMRIDSSGNVGINNSNPLGKLQITSGDSGASSAWSNADELILESSGNAGLAFQTPNTGAATIAFQDPESVQAGFIQYLHSDNLMRFATNGNNIRAVIDASGNVGIGTTSPQAILHTSAPYPTYTHYGTVFYGGTTNNSSQNGIMLASAGNALSGVIGSNLFVDGTNWSQTNTGRSTGWLSMVNTTVAGETSTLRYNGYVKGNNTTVERFIIDGTGQVGIGTNAPTSIFHLKHDAPVLTSESTNTVSGFRINVLGGGSQLLRVQNAGTTKFQIDPNGGIYLSGSTAAANALDDYEEGSWTPILSWNSGGDYTMDNGTTIGRYTKIGNLVYVTCTVKWTAAPTNTSGNLVVRGLPFTIAGVRNAGSISAVAAGALSFTSSSYTQWTITGDPGRNDFYIIQQGGNVGYTHRPTVSSTGTIYSISLTYRV